MIVQAMRSASIVQVLLVVLYVDVGLDVGCSDTLVRSDVLRWSVVIVVAVAVGFDVAVDFGNVCTQLVVFECSCPRATDFQKGWCAVKVSFLVSCSSAAVDGKHEYLS